MGITLDNASNNGAFIRLLTNWAIEQRIPFDKDENHFRCFAHVINLSVQSALAQLESEISKVKLLFNIFIIFINSFFNTNNIIISYSFEILLIKFVHLPCVVKN
jgi:hypothetical protein